MQHDCVQQSLSKMQQAVGGTSGSSQSCLLLQQPVGVKCLAALLAVGKGRLRKMERKAPDMRYGKFDYQSRRDTWSVDGFLQVAYDTIAETLPVELLGYLCRLCRVVCCSL